MLQTLQFERLSDTAVEAMVSERSDLDHAWGKIRKQLRAELGEDVFTSWFGRIEPVSVQDGAAEFSVATKFLKTWVQAHYAGRMLAHLQLELPVVDRVLISVRVAVGLSH